MVRAVDVAYLDFSKAFGTLSHSLLLDKLAKYRLDERSVKWVGMKLANKLHSKGSDQWFLLRWPEVL